MRMGSPRPAARFFAAFYRWSCHGPGRSPHGNGGRDCLRLRPALARHLATTGATADAHLKHPRRGEDAGEDGADRADRLRSSVRTIMRTVPYPVVVLTAAARDASTDEPVPLGTAVSSFNTVTLDPPTISFNIKHPSRSLDAIRADRGRFRLHFLLPRPASAQIVDSFTKGNTDEALRERRQFTHIDTSDAGASGAAHLRHENVVASMECELTHEMAVGDHFIVAAKVTTVSYKDHAESLMMYVRGNYTRHTGEVIARHEPVPWSAPLFPGKADQEALELDVKRYLTAQPKLNSTIPLVVRETCTALGIPPIEPLGVRLSAIVALEMKKRGQPIDSNEPLSPTSLPFFGRLTSSNMTAITEKIIDHVRHDERFLSRSSETLFIELGVSVCHSGILASDIMDALRAAGLAPPFQPHVGLRKSTVPTLQVLEQLEHSLRKQLRSKDPHDAWVGSTLSLSGARISFVHSWCLQTRVRLHVEAFPEYHDSSHYDFSGHLSIYEARIAVCRIVAEFIKTPDNGSSILPWEILRRARVHPLVTGFDPDFLIKSLVHWRKTYPSDVYIEKVNQLMGSHFRPLVNEEELPGLVHDLVQNATLRAVSWGFNGLLTALGLQKSTSVVSKLRKESYPIEMSHLEPLLREALERRRDGFSGEERDAVDRYLGKLPLESTPLFREVSGESPTQIEQSSTRIDIPAGQENSVSATELEIPTQTEPPPTGVDMPAIHDETPISATELMSVLNLQSRLNKFPVLESDKPEKDTGETGPPKEKKAAFTAYGFDGPKSVDASLSRPAREKSRFRE